MKSYYFFIFILLSLLSPSLAEQKIDQNHLINFKENILPIFENKCTQCHNSDKIKGGLNLRSKRSAFSGSDSGLPALVAGDLEKSELWQRITTDDKDDFMPAKGDPLTDSETRLIKQWIETGANWPDDGSADSIHWAYKPLTKVDPTQLQKTKWVKNEIDRFIYSRMEKAQLKPNPPADKGIWLRRVSLDLTGLPPSLKEYRDFMNDDSINAEEKVIDRLLSSSKYGEFWATYWLDLARFADSGGYQDDHIRYNWAYRDWVIKALNQNMPYDQFSIEQLAGDLIENATFEQKIATGFHRNTPCNLEAGVVPEENRVNQVVDRVNVTGTIWLGTTLECAQCHSHKYDPFSQKEYYQLFSFFNNTPLEVKGRKFIGPKMELPLSDEKKQKLKHLKEQLKLKSNELKIASKSKYHLLDSWSAKTLDFLTRKDQQNYIQFDDMQSSEPGVSLKNLERSIILVTGLNPPKNQYTLNGKVNAQSPILGVRLDVFPHESTPNGGVSRESGEATSIYGFNSFDVFLTKKKKKIKLDIASASSPYTESSSNIHHAIDDSEETFWAIGADGSKVAHSSFFIFKEPITIDQHDRITIEMKQYVGRMRTLGSFGIAAIEERGPWENLNEKEVKLIQANKKTRSQKEQNILKQAFMKNHPDLKNLYHKVENLKKESERIKPDTTLVMIEMDTPRDTHIMKRGVYTSPGLKVHAGVPSILPTLTEESEQNRLGFAKWLFKNDHPLVSRVTVNRYWLRLMGKGIVLTPEDFGTQSDPPTHPQLLDWLANDFIESGWNVKNLIKTIVMSQTYRQSSNLTPEKLERDSNNQYYSFMKRRRLSAEAIRDNMLQITGLMNDKMYGPPTYPPQPAEHWANLQGPSKEIYTVSDRENRFRRSVYTIWKRTAPYLSYINFDAPDRSSCVVERSHSNTPIQALTMMNDPVYLEFAKSFAISLMSKKEETTIESALNFGFRKAFTRDINPTELRFLSKKLDEYRNYYNSKPELSKSLIESIKAIETPAAMNAAELSAWICVSNIILNLDEVIMKG